jgi:peptidoglycan LD-endopeptidase CwlK
MRLPINLSPSFPKTRDLTLLVPEFRAKVADLLAACQKRGVKMVPYTTLIGPAWEAELYCRSRQWWQVQPVAETIRAGGAPKLAALLKPELCKGGAWASNALPGRSWHSWGEAVDCFVEGPKATALWVSPGYAVYAEEARKLGLTAGHYWQMKDSVHVQLRAAGGVRDLTWAEVQAQMETTFEL